MRHAHSNVARLRGKLAPQRPAIAMASHNPLFAKLAAEAGFDAIWGSGFELSAAYAVPDASILSADTHLELHSDPGGSIRRPSDPTSTPRFAAGVCGCSAGWSPGSKWPFSAHTGRSHLASCNRSPA